MPELVSRGRTFTSAGATDAGRVRSGNEDRLLLDPEHGIFAVVDGVGGHAAGEVAASIAVDVIGRRLERPLWSPEQRVREAIALANNEILSHAQSSPQYAGMTCVLTLALLDGQRLTIGHVGDTRLYKLTPEGMAKLTHDHSPIGEREDSGELSESAAMRHPRRNEVFRDVGSIYHEPEDPDFVEVIETPFDARTAVLMCSDGLSDMVTAAAIERTIRQHAGNPGRVVEALIQAANEAGGKDNVSAIYIEGPAFAHALPVGTPSPDARGNAPTESVRRDWGTRATWLSIGLVAGLALGLGLAWILERYAPVGAQGGRTLVVAPSGSDGLQASFPTIGAALLAARPGDVVRIEPGDYQESVVLPAGVELIAREPGRVRLVARPGQPGSTALVAEGRTGNRISGITVFGRSDAPFGTGLRLSGHAIDVDDVRVEGEVGIGVDVMNDGDITMRGSRLANTGLAVRLGPGARPVIRQNVFAQTPGHRHPAIEAAADAAATVERNTFVGYHQLVGGMSLGDTPLLENNFIVRPGTQPSPARRGR
jgi:serine/threonine protein phosphatase PrpC